ncbi:S8 family serine peptidase [Micromonospora sp. CB01531]|uniref:S8 family serine peptidase n=1 Tax=Micromonospora sp. CB01531 TaxID=1718947 RepID=UPI0013012097|nr:S8 family serine peptidase [Micromonospora sp. CB01531]
MSRTLLASLAAVALAAMPATAHAAGDPPALPSGTGSCVGESPVVASTPPWPLRRLAPSNVWPLTRGDGVLVAVLDTGVSATAGGLTGGVVRSGIDVVTSGRADRDCLGRGTALAGIVAARPVSGSAFVGVAPGATVLPVRIVDSKGQIPPGAIAKGIRAATAAGADVILLAVGTSAPDTDLTSAVRTAVAQDIVVVAAVSDQKPSGTVGQGAPPWYPAADNQVLGVGGVGPNGVPTQTSSPEAGVDLLAPGAGAVSVAPHGHGHYSVGGPAVAAAYVAGAAALVRAYHAELDQAEVRHRLELTAEHPLDAQQASAAEYGTLDLYAAVSALDIAASPLPASQPQPVILRTAATDRVKVIAGLVAAGTVAMAALAYVSAVVIKWGRRRRWRP